MLYFRFAGKVSGLSHVPNIGTFIKKNVSYILNIFLVLSLLLSIFNIAPVFSQAEKRATTEMWNKLIVGSTIIGQYATYKFHENGIMTGRTSYKGVYGDVRVLWTFTEKEGFCRMNGKVTFSDGRERDLGRKCHKNTFFAGQTTIRIDGTPYQILRSTKATEKKQKKIENDFSTLKNEFLKLSPSERIYRK